VTRFALSIYPSTPVMFFIPIIDAHRRFEGERVRVNKGHPQ